LAAKTVATLMRTSLGPKGMDKMLVRYVLVCFNVGLALMEMYLLQMTVQLSLRKWRQVHSTIFII